MKKIRLFCFPYAGGSAMVYNPWQNSLDKSIRLHPVELAGRGRRITDPLYNTIEEAADDVFQIIKYQLGDLPYAFFGHSMGALIAYNVAQKIREKKYPGPSHIFFSGRGAPHIRRDDKEPYHTMPHDEFKEKVLNLGGTPKELFEHPELMEILLPLLRSDFRLAWCYKHKDSNNPLDCDITVFTGKEEDLKNEQIQEWDRHTNYQCTLYSFEGGHFFINDPTEREKMLTIVSNTLVELAAGKLRNCA
jgi:surfactin synthase thioesterase subunit